ncbi:hypothetical protein D9613_002393 [Agrocybe pediades]|uniref:Uncharacterized protein n=1 Tax=Agrocybe pediades TaxID=84607 RepID=A0A8H4R715_9AGAR|nr:hypothetical protein D9613_002393 [Agrocybe pediades]
MPTRFFIAAVAVISETIGCTSTMYMDMYHAADTHPNKWVKEQALSIILRCANELKVEDEGLKDCELPDLLRGMVMEAPHLAGQRDFILEWLLMSASPYTAEVSKDDPMIGWELRCRDGIKCPITGFIDLERLQDELEPEVDEDLQDVIEVRYFINIPPPNLISGLKETPNTYTTQLMRGGVFSPNGDLSREVVFRSVEEPCKVSPPDIRFVKTYSALANLVEQSGAFKVHQVSMIRRDWWTVDDLRARLDAAEANL